MELTKAKRDRIFRDLFNSLGSSGDQVVDDQSNLESDTWTFTSQVQFRRHIFAGTKTITLDVTNAIPGAKLYAIIAGDMQTPIDFLAFQGEEGLALDLVANAAVFSPPSPSNPIDLQDGYYFLEATYLPNSVVDYVDNEFPLGVVRVVFDFSLPSNVEAPLITSGMVFTLDVPQTVAIIGGPGDGFFSMEIFATSFITGVTGGIARDSNDYTLYLRKSADREDGLGSENSLVFTEADYPGENVPIPVDVVAVDLAGNVAYVESTLIFTDPFGVMS